MDTVRTSDGRRVFEFPCASLQYLGKLLEVFADNRRRLLQPQRLRGVDHVVRGEAVVQPTRLRYDLLGYCSGEGDDVVLHLGFDLVDAVEVEAALFAHGLGGRLRHQSGLGERFRGCELDLEPGLKLVLVTPDAADVGAGVTSNHRTTPCS